MKIPRSLSVRLSALMALAALLTPTAARAALYDFTWTAVPQTSGLLSSPWFSYGPTCHLTSQGVTSADFEACVKGWGYYKDPACKSTPLQMDYNYISNARTFHRATWTTNAACHGVAAGFKAVAMRVAVTPTCAVGYLWNAMSDCILAPPDKNLGEAGAGACVGDPCNAANGNEYQIEADFEGGAGVPAYTRYYNSQLPGDSGLGFGWTSSASKGLAVSQTTVYARYNSGKLEPFSCPAATGPCIGDSDNLYTLTKTSSGYTVNSRDGSVLQYKANGLRSSETDAQGRTTTYAYTNWLLSSIRGPYGHNLTIAYNGTRIASVTAPSGAVYGYSYDTNGNLVRVDYPDSTAKIYHYEDAALPHLLTGISYVNTNGIAKRFLTIGYDANGKATFNEHAGAVEHYTLSYDSDTQTTVTDAVGTQEVMLFAENLGVKNLVSKTNQADGKSVTQTFDANNNLVCRKDQEGRVATYTYNSSNQMTAKTEGQTGDCTSPVATTVTRTRTYQYLSPTLDLATLVESPSVYSSHSKTLTIAYGDPGHPNLPTSLTLNGYTPDATAITRTMGITYTAAGQIQTIDGPRTDVSDIITFSYYVCTIGVECGQLQSSTNALGQTTSYDTYDADGRLTQVTDANGLRTNFDYDGRGRIATIKQTPPGGSARITQYTYDPAGNVVTETFPNGRVLTYSYNDAEELIRVVDNLGNYISYGYDSRGNLSDEDTYDPADTLIRTADYAYDLRNRPQTINAAGSITSLVYDAVGNLVSETDPNDHTTAYTPDPLNRISQKLDALNHISASSYDVNDVLTLAEAPNGATTTYVYDDLSNLLSENSPDRGSTTYEYDEAGNVISKTDANGVAVSYAYDPLNRLTSITYPDSSLNVTLVYDEGTNQNGRLTTMIDASGTTTYGYDLFGNVTSETKHIDGNTYVTAYTYDAADLLESLTYPSGRTVTYTRNTTGQITAVDTTYDTTSLTVAQDGIYLPFGPLSGLTFGNGLVMSRTFDQQYRLTNQTTGTIQNVTFTPDAAGNIDAITDAVNPSLSQSFTQDALDRVDHEAGAYGTEDYTYDEVGNRLTRSGPSPQTLTYAPNSNRLATHDGTAVMIDGAGNVTADPAQTLTFSYGDHNRMLAAYVGGTLKATYVYNGHGQRVKKVEATGAQRTFVFHYGLSDELIGETVYDSTGAKIAERDYLWLDALPIAQSERTFAGSTITSDALVYLHADQLESPRLASNGSGTVVWRWDSDAFGVGNAVTDPDGDDSAVSVRLRFPGQYLDEETGLPYNYFRDYDPVTGRYVESDPIGLGGGINTYAYAGGNALSNYDPFGLECISVGGVMRCIYPGGGPDFRLPAPSGQPATMGPNNFLNFFLYHKYDVQVPLDRANANCVMRKMIENPTPGAPNAASQSGTLNNAQVFGMDNWVKSYLTSDLNSRRPIVVNVADSNSAFPPGYVARTVSDGVAHTYGEGLAGVQAIPFAQRIGNWWYWERQMKQFVEECSCQN